MRIWSASATVENRCDTTTVIAPVLAASLGLTRFDGQPGEDHLSGPPPSGEATSSRLPTAFQDFLDQHGIPQLKSWRAVSS
jgi:hypothetical protein